jgi:1-acyl-sn-glycerol-3-phosphate acyltransferase
MAGALARTAPAALRAPLSSPRGRRRIAVRAAAEVLAAAGVRVEVHAAPVAWPSSALGRLVVANRVCWVDDLALHTVVPGTPVAEWGRLDGDAQAARPGRFRPAIRRAAVDSGAPVCPVAVRYRADGRASAGPLADGPWWRSVAQVVGTRRLVVEVHLLAALEPSGTSRRELAVLAEYAVAAVLEEPDRRPADPPGARPVPRGTSGGSRARAGSDVAVR